MKRQGNSLEWDSQYAAERVAHRHNSRIPREGHGADREPVHLSIGTALRLGPPTDATVKFCCSRRVALPPGLAGGVESALCCVAQFGPASAATAGSRTEILALFI